MIDDWSRRFAEVIASAVREFGPSLRGVPLALLAVDCHPWHGSLGLAVLTAAEAESDPLLMNPGEMAAWRYYLFSDRLESWHLAAGLAREMQATYETASDRAAVAGAFFSACALAMEKPEVVEAIDRLERAPNFRISVAHPDSGEEFYLMTKRR
jgi:hypothetical protein